MDSTCSLVSAASSGDSVAIEALLERHLPGLRAFVRLRAGRLVRAKESCSDIAQSVCRELLQDLDGFRYEGEAAFRAWLYTAAARKIVARARYYRAQRRDVRRERSVGDDELSRGYACFQTPSRGVMEREQMERIEAAFDQLPDDYREVILLAKIAGLSHADIGRRLGRTTGAVATLLYRALARLSFLLEPR